MSTKPRSIKVDADAPFEEELLPQMTLLHVRFKDNMGYSYRWTPRIRGGEVERVFFKMLEVEERNSPEGAWSEELKIASEQVASLKDFRLPVKVTLAGLDQIQHESWAYRIDVCIWPNGEEVTDAFGGKGFRVGRCNCRKSSFNDLLFSELAGKWNIGLNEKVTSIYPVEWNGWGDPPSPVAVSFHVWIPKGLSQEDHQIIGRELAGAVRRCIRKVLLDLRAIEKGFEEHDTQP